MCLSATASFTVSALLTPTAIYTLQRAIKERLRYTIFCIFIFAFAIQQFIEGFIWLAMNDGQTEKAVFLSKFFIFFSHFLWPLIIPFTSFILEQSKPRKKLFLFISIVSVFYSLLLYLPLVFGENKITVEISHHSIRYVMDLFYDQYMDRQVSGYFYVFLVTAPYILSSDRHIKILGIILIASYIPTYLFFYHALTSIWCFMASVISIYIVYMVREDHHGGGDSNV